MKRWKPFLYPLVVIIVGVALVAMMMAKPKSSLAAPELAVTVDPLANAPTVATLSPQPGFYAPQLQLYSQLQSRQQVGIPSPVATDVRAVRVVEGDPVNEGDVLVVLNTDQLKRQLKQLQARRLDLQARQEAETLQYQSHVASLEIERQLVDIAQRSVQRVSDLRKQNLTSSAELETAERTLQNQRLSLQNRELSIARYELTMRQYSAQLLELDSQIESAQEQLDDATVRAPFAGLVSQVQIQPGSTVTAGQALLTLVDPTQQELVAWVSANVLPQATAIQSLQGVLEYENALVPVSVMHADPAASGGSLRLFFQTEQMDGRLVLNRYYRLWLNLPPVETYAVPEASVYSNRFVYQIVDDRLQRMTVDVLGERFQDGELWRLVRGDLNGADILVTRLANASQGLAVRAAQTSSALAVVE